MKIEYIDPYHLTSFEKNNKLHSPEQVKRIAKSIDKFGFLQPVVIDDNNVIVVGHARVEAQKLRGNEPVPVIRTKNLTDAEIREYRIVDNKLAEQGVFDIENLKFEVTDLDLEIAEWGIFPVWDTEKQSNEDLWDELGNEKFDHDDKFGHTLTIQFETTEQRLQFLKRNGYLNATEKTKSAIYEDDELRKP